LPNPLSDALAGQSNNTRTHTQRERERERERERGDFP
jgi:hypothetical protein